MPRTRRPKMTDDEKREARRITAMRKARSRAVLPDDDHDIYADSDFCEDYMDRFVDPSTEQLAYRMPDPVIEMLDADAIPNV